MATYEYELLTLRRLPHGREDQFHWHSDCHGAVGEHGELQEYLNQRGQGGWKVAAYASDGHFGNTIILQREQGGVAPPVTGGESIPWEEVVKSALANLPPPAPAPDLTGVAQSVAQSVSVALGEATRELKLDPQELATALAAALMPALQRLATLSEQHTAQLQSLAETVVTALPEPAPVAAEPTPAETQDLWRWFSWRKSPVLGKSIKGLAS